MSKSSSSIGSPGSQGHSPRPGIFAGAGEACALLRSIDWTTRPVGAADSWPPSLVTTLGICLGSPDPVCIVWGRERTLFYNDACIPLVGAKHPDAFGASSPKVWETEDAGLQSAIESVLETGRAVRFDHFTICPIPGESEGAKGVFVTFAENHRVDGRFLDSGAYFRLATKTGKVGVWDWNIVQNHIAWSESLYVMHGVDPEHFDATVEGFSALVHPLDRERVGESIRRALENDDPYEIEFRAIRADQSVIWVFTNAMVMRREGRPVRMLGATMDVTERKLAEIALRESESRFAGFTQNLPGLAWIKDLDGRYVYVNDAAARAFRGKLDEIVGKTDVELFPPETAAMFRENDLMALEMRKSVETIESLEHEDGVHQSIVSKFPIYSHEGTPDLIGGIAVDITARVRAEEALLEADRRKDEFLATLAHELRNPLAPLRSSLNVLGLLGETGPVREMHEVMKRQVDQLVRLVDDLLEVSRITGGKIELRRQRMDLARAIHAAVETSRPQIEAAGHRLAVDLPAEVLVVEGDSIRLTQVFANLLNNAAKYTEEGGQIRLEATRKGAEAVITVRDNGIGIPEEMLPRVFDLFTQVDRTLGRAQGGLGIGLSLVKRLVEKHGGRVEARSGLSERGSEFVVCLPLVPEGADPAGDDAHRMPDTSAASLPDRILVVDDNRDAAESLSILLRSLGIEVRIAHDGSEALEVLAAFQPEIVLLDLGMPGMDGYEVARRIRARPGGGAVRLVALTGWGQREDRRRSREAGFDEHIIKPVEFDVLRTLLLSVGSSPTSTS